MSGLVSEEDLARARVDRMFRHQLMAESLDRLLDLLNQMRRAPNNSTRHAQQIEEGVALAVQLADRLQIEHDAGPEAA